MNEPQLLIEALYSYGGDREDRLTEVFKTVLEVNHDFSRALPAGWDCGPSQSDTP